MQVVILAAGESSRFWPLAEGTHKSFYSLLGEPIIAHTLEALRRAHLREIIIVQSPDRALEKELSDGSRWGVQISYVMQEQPRGMGDALQQAQPLLRDRFVVLNPQHLVIDQIFPRLAQLSKADVPAVLAGCPTDRPHEYGMLAFKGDHAVDLVEKPAIGKEPSRTRIAGIYLLSQTFFDAYQKATEHPYAFEETLRSMMQSHALPVLQVNEDLPTLKYPWDLFPMVKLLMDREITAQKIAPTVQIHKSAIIEGLVCIGEETKIFEHAVIKGPCYIGQRCVVGTGSLVREYSNLEDGTIIGAHAEVARSIFGKDCSTHSGYFGDSIFADSVRIGAGTVTANVRNDRRAIYSLIKGQRTETGFAKLGAIVGRETHIGICSMLMPGVLIGPRCEIGPGTLVLKNIKADTRYYTKPREIISQRR